MFTKVRFGIAFMGIAFLFSSCGGGGNSGGGNTQPQTQPMATPAISPVTGNAGASSVTVTITDATAGATIYYTTDGSTPTTVSNKYSAAFVLNCPAGMTITLKAYAPAMSSSYTDSSVASATYTCQTQVATPVISPATSNASASTVSVSITDATAGATIYYTTDGSTPTASSNKYSAAFALSCPVGSTVTLKAYAPAVGSNYTDSAVASATYTCQQQTAAPVIAPVTGNVMGTQTVTITESTNGASIYYTTDGSTPSPASNKYSGSFQASQPTGKKTLTIQAYAAAPNSSYVDSSLASVTYTFIQNPTIQAGTLSSPILLNATNVSLPITVTNCDSMTYTVTPAFPAPTDLGGIQGYVSFIPNNACQPIFHPGSTMPATTNGNYQYTITFTAIGDTGTTPVSASITISLTTPTIQMDVTPVTPSTLPAGSGSATQIYQADNCGFTSYNGLSATDMWTGTLDGEGTPDDAKNGIVMDFVDCNHVSDSITYNGTDAGDQIWDYLYNPPPGGGTSSKIITTFVATSANSSIAVSADGTTATLKSQSTINYLDAEGNIAKTVTSAPGTLTFGSQTIPAGDIQQLIACGSNAANFCGLGKNQLTVFTSNGVATKVYALPEDAKFAVANNDSGIYVFADKHLYNLVATGTAVTLMAGFASDQSITAAAISGNELAALSSNGQLQRFNVDSGSPIGTYTVPADMNNIAYTRDGSILVGKLGATEVTVLDRSGAVNTLVLTAPLKTIVQAEQSDPIVSLETGDVIKVDSIGNTTLVTHAAKPEDLNAGFRIMGRTLVLTHVDPVSNTRQVQTLAVRQ
jgi:hypothetical protein